jgi:hypothetical protein
MQWITVSQISRMFDSCDASWGIDMPMMSTSRMIVLLPNC